MRTTAIILLLLLSSVAGAQTLPGVTYIHWNDDKKTDFARVAQFQLRIPFVQNKSDKLPLISVDASFIDRYLHKIDQCLDIARDNKANILVFPELAVSLPQPYRDKLMDKYMTFSKQHDAIIVCGTYYNGNRQGVCPVVLPGEVHNIYKLKPSIFESCIEKDKGMRESDSMFVFKTKYGNFAVIVCVDMISDDANYMIRRLANHNEIEMAFNIEYNPASREFLREASSMAHRHALSVSEVNVAGQGSDAPDGKDECYGYSGVACHTGYLNRMDFLDTLPSAFRDQKGNLQEAYGNVLYILAPSEEAALLYDRNLRLNRVPLSTNGPDQHYSTIKNICKIAIKP